MLLKRVAARGARRLWAAMRGAPAKPGLPAVDRWHLESEVDCIRYLVGRAASLRTADRDRVLIVADPGANREALASALRAQGITCETRSIADLSTSHLDTSMTACLIPGSFESGVVSRVARVALADPRLRDLPFEYILSRTNHGSLERFDSPAYRGFYFIGPLLADGIDYRTIYEESLERFDRKCDVRDYLDVCQLVRELVINGVPGDVAEFGSFKGHSGYLISRLLEAHGSAKTLHMFDTFRTFPVESLGVDQFWSDTHDVQFEEVSRKLSGRANVKLVQGEFETTVPRELPPEIAFAYVDCDSYRATRHLIGAVYDRLAPGGFMAFEDYGHPALLGNRLAVDEALGSRPGCWRWFSQFSGIYVVRKA
jgi:O-methyltransferase